MKLVKLAPTPDAPNSHDDPRALARSTEAVRLNWNRGSRRIVGDAQDRVALERPRIVRSDPPAAPRN
jgi:hypothetical protein